MPRRSRQSIADAYRAATLKLGTPPGAAKFSKLTSIPMRDVLHYWPGIGTLATELGLKANLLQQTIPQDELFADYAKICLQLEKVPTNPELRIATREMGTRTHSLTRRFPSTAARDDAFKKWLESQTRTEIRAILDLPGWTRKQSRTVVTTPVDAKLPVTVLFHPFLPTCCQWLDVLARGDRPPNDDGSTTVSLQFERRVADAFRCLGFDVTTLGQGSGRTADCVAVAERERFAAVIDAKVRAGGYRLGTEDRKFAEYVASHGQSLQAKGVERIYFLVVAPSFREGDLEKLAAAVTGSAVRSVVFVTAAALMRWVEQSIERRHSFALAEFERELFGNRIVAA